jgi:hypothetical protein
VNKTGCLVNRRKIARVKAARIDNTNPSFNLGTLAGGLSNNFFSTLLSGGGLSSALNQSLGQLQPALFQIAQGGQQATDAFTALGVKGVGSVGALTQGMAGLASGALLAAQAAGTIGQEIGKAYEQQKDFVFQSGILAKQLGTTAEEGAKLRALLTLVGQEDNIFAAITLNQIRAGLHLIGEQGLGLHTSREVWSGPSHNWRVYQNKWQPQDLCRVGSGQHAGLQGLST